MLFHGLDNNFFDGGGSLLHSGSSTKVVVCYSLWSGESAVDFENGLFV